MIFFGWGRDSRAWKYGADGALVATWSYIHVFWCPLAFNTEWTLLGDRRSEDRSLTYAEVVDMVDGEPPKVSVWHRYGLLIAIGLIVIIGSFS